MALKWKRGRGGEGGDGCGRLGGNFRSQCPMPNAQCPMPNAQCPMPHAQYPMLNTQCPIPVF
ncbi:MAG: hypothetical protein ACHBN1_28790 [Heteroscytonema crispum UTEX LB 1556]